MGTRMGPKKKETFLFEIVLLISCVPNPKVITCLTMIKMLKDYNYFTVNMSVFFSCTTSNYRLQNFIDQSFLKIIQ